jgi:FkbM family methyltransferase
MTIRLAHSSNSYGIFLHDGFSDPQVADLFMSFLRPGMVVFDCGAHIGELTLLFSQLAGPQGKVHAFEPDPRTLPYLEENIRTNGLKQVVLNPVAVGEKQAEVAFSLARDPTSSSVTTRCSSSDPAVDTAKVSMISLDSYVQQNGLSRIDAIKIDTEGSELAVIHGASALLQKRIPDLLFIECDDHANEQPIKDLLTSYGYEVNKADRHGKGLHPHLIARRSLADTLRVSGDNPDQNVGA